MRAKNILSKIQGTHALGIAIVILSLFLTFATDGFFTTYNLMNVLRQISLTCFMAIGFGITLIAGGMDISMGAVAALNGVIVAWLVAVLKVNIFVSILIPLAIGVFIGMINGAIIAYLGVPPFIQTLAMNFVVQGINFEFTGGYPIYTGFPKKFLGIAQGYVGRIPVPVIIMVLVFIITDLFLKNTRSGQHLYAVGGNEESARLNGVNVRKTKWTAFGISGFFAALTGVVMTARLSAGQPAAAGMNFFLQSATAAILGGIALSGGEGNMLGVLFGALFLGIVNNGLTLLKVSAYFQWIVMGVLLILAIVWNSVRETLRGGKYG
jgi:ribose transport system permease protein